MTDNDEIKIELPPNIAEQINGAKGNNINEYKKVEDQQTIAKLESAKIWHKELKR